MAQNTFEYAGLHFIPIGALPPKSEFVEITKYCENNEDLKISKSNHNYSIEEFYEKSTNKQADIFYCMEKRIHVLPASNFLFEYSGEFRYFDEDVFKNDIEIERLQLKKQNIEEHFFNYKQPNIYKYNYGMPNKPNLERVQIQAIYNNMTIKDLITAYNYYLPYEKQGTIFEMDIIDKREYEPQTFRDLARKTLYKHGDYTFKKTDNYFLVTNDGIYSFSKLEDLTCPISKKFDIKKIVDQITINELAEYTLENKEHRQMLKKHKNIDFKTDPENDTKYTKQHQEEL